jgi:hypothetical protein
VSSVGGTTDPVPGSYTYPEGTTITLTATPNEGFEFLYWVASGEFTPGTTDAVPNIVIEGEPAVTIPPPPTVDYLIFTNNPAEVICGYGYTYQYQAVFSPIAAGGQPPEPVELFPDIPDVPVLDPPTAREETTFVGVSSTAGGSTNPGTGRYLLSEQVDPDITLTATPDAGYKFQHWVVYGEYMPGHGGDPSLDLTLITANPLNVQCGRGYEYSYQAVFTEITNGDGNGDGNGNGDGGPEPEHPFFGLSSELILALFVILLIVAIIGIAFGAYAYRKNK